jgi:hypothetical protein
VESTLRIGIDVMPKRWNQLCLGTIFVECILLMVSISNTSCNDTKAYTTISRGDWYAEFHDNANSNRSNTVSTTRLVLKWNNTSAVGGLTSLMNGGDTISSHMVFYNNNTGIYSHDGKLVWIDVNGDVIKTRAYLQWGLTPAPSLRTDGTIVITANTKEILLININNRIRKLHYFNDLNGCRVYIDNNDSLILTPDSNIVKYNSKNLYCWEYGKYGTGDIRINSDMQAVDAKNNVYLILYDGTLLSVSESGNLNWEFHSMQQMAVNSPVVCEKGVIIPGWKYLDLISFNGKLIWKIPLISKISGQTICLTKSNYIVIVCDDGKCMAVDMDGKILWQRSGMRDCAAVVGSSKVGTVYTLYDKYLEIVSESNGQLIDRFELAEDDVLLGQLSVSDSGSLISTGLSGVIYAFEE